MAGFLKMVTDQTLAPTERSAAAQSQSGLAMAFSRPGDHLDQALAEEVGLSPSPQPHGAKHRKRRRNRTSPTSFPRRRKGKNRIHLTVRAALENIVESY